MDANTPRRNGFTLISLLIALGVIAITMAIGGPALWEISHEIKLKNAAREAITAMRAARYRAINESREFGFSATTGTTLDSPGLMKIFEGDNPADVNAWSREIPMGGGILVSTSVFDDGNFVIFSPDGSADTDGDIVLTNPNRHAITVSLRPASTARMQVSKVEELP